MNWEILFSLGTLILLAALVYGFVQYRSRNKANDAITEEATRQLREDPEAYAEGGREKLQAQLKD